MMLGLAAGLLMAAALPASAIDPKRAMSQYIHNRWGPEQGFPKGTVYAISQSADGYLWIGTDAGLVRFDGWDFRVMPDDPRAPKVNNILGVMPDAEGSLWVRVQGPTMLRYRGGAFEEALAGLPYSNITAMCRSRGGDLMASAPEQGTILRRNGKFEMIADTSAMPRSPVISLAQTTDGDVWMGTRGAGLFRLSGKATREVIDGLPAPKINCLLAGPHGELWIGTDWGVAHWDGKTLTTPNMGQTGRRLQALAMVKDRDQNLWVGTDSRGLLRLNQQGVASLNANTPGAGAITAVFEDREGALWFGSANGLERLRDSAFVSYSSAEGLPTDGSTPIFVDAGNRVWFAPIRGGLWRLQDGKGEQVTGGGIEKDVIYSITGSGEDLWLGRQRGGLTRLRLNGGAYTTATHTQADGLAQNSVYSVHQARDGTVWAGTLSGGVSRLQNGVFQTYHAANGLASNTVVAIEESAGGAMWFATPTGLSSFSNGHWRTYTKKDGLPSENVNCLLEDSKGMIWVGTAAGLAFGGSGGFQTPDASLSALKEQILGITEDRFGSLWMSTSNHVLSVRRDKLAQGKAAESELREYELADGLRGLEGVKRHRSVVSDPLGRIWFSMNLGISVADPGRLAGNSAPPISHIQTITADGIPVDLRGPVRVPPGSKRIEFGYTGLSLSVPERVRFRYSLDGFDPGWSQPVAAREAVYTNLGPRKYRFHVISSNLDGSWSTSESSVEFEIGPQYWQTWWFRLAALCTVLLAIWSSYRLRMRELTGRLNLRFEERLAERTRIAQELHDTLLQGFLSASMHLHLAVEQLPEGSREQSSVNHVVELMRRVIDEGRNAVRGLRSVEHIPIDLGEAFSNIKQEVALSDEIEFQVAVEGHPIPLHLVLRDEVYRIGREGLVNAFRHSRATRIEVELVYTRKEFRLNIRDNGIGIEPAILGTGRDGHWGLTGMRERAERIGGQLLLWSSATAGTELELRVPGHVAYPSAPPGRARRWLSRIFSRKQAVVKSPLSHGDGQ
jgi:signal transduction histidine kinase/ligand-binding sensor domain-containing protein